MILKLWARQPLFKVRLQIVEERAGWLKNVQLDAIRIDAFSWNYGGSPLLKSQQQLQSLQKYCSIRFFSLSKKEELDNEFIITGIFTRLSFTLIKCNLQLAKITTLPIHSLAPTPPLLLEELTNKFFSCYNIRAYSTSINTTAKPG